MKTLRHLGGVALFGVVVAMVLLAAEVTSSQEPDRGPAQASMRGVFVVLSSVYGYSLDQEAFADPRNGEEIRTKLEALARNVDQVEAHGAGLDPSFDFMRGSLSRDAHEALSEFKAKNYIGSRFILGQITENCVTCHTKLPADRPFEPGREFLNTIDVAQLPPPARANLQVAARQFSDAMTTYEEVLKSREATAADLSTFDVFGNYLRISIGALSDTRRPIQAFKEFVRRTDMPDALKADVRAWTASLETLKLDVPTSKELATGRNMVTQARAKTTSFSDRQQLVEFIASITFLHRYLSSDPESDVDVAEAYYLLGVAESYVSRSYWVSETEYLLAKAIRLVPKSGVAKDALAFLEGYRSSAYNVIPARELPPELQTNIDDLRKLTEQ
ncbi:MAG: hypothetical protein OEX18_08700 [Candidatus Krumholzibacteria bacterium]|nr:hypothetical protein [Candidatus Krumholzibacteria bacterium]MDH4337337.1 hypothetical protein [Candidatus Krumholzibacteria bacterium]MDH5270098.1 hypothetical protein [Candidatus Krumholzibacteria bacterium]